MAGDMVTLVKTCGVCKTELESFEVKKENMMLFTKATIWCPHCQAERPEVRDVAGRHDAIQKEAGALPKPERT